MGVRGTSELLAALPPAAADPLAVISRAVHELSELRHAVLRPEEVRALGELLARARAQVESLTLQALAAMDSRDDVVPGAKPGQAAAMFEQHVVGQPRARARRDAHTAGLLRAEVGDLPRIGAALRDGDITPAHVEVAVRTHRELGATAREALVPYAEILGVRPAEAAGGTAPGHEVVGDLAEAFADLLADGDVRSDSTATQGSIRQVLLVDAVLAHCARRLDVDQLEAVARRIVEALNPKGPTGAHERRYLHMSPLPGGAWVGRFECGGAQGAFLKAALAAFSAPRPGLAIDADGVEHALSDDRDVGARQMDALVDLVTAALAKNGVTLPTSGPGTDEDDRSSRPTEPVRPDAPSDASASASEPPDRSEPTDHFEPEEPPDSEGEYSVVRRPGVLAGPLPVVELIVPVGIEHLAAAHATQLAQGMVGDGDGVLPLGGDAVTAVRDWLRRRPWQRPPRDEQHLDDRRGRQPTAADDETRRDETPPDETPPDETPPDQTRPDQPRPDQPSPDDGCTSGGVAGLRRALSGRARPPRLEHAGPVDAATLRLLADCAQLRTALVSPEGAVLHLGRAQRLVSAAQKRALIARDGGCVIPGCTVTADACQAHHVTAWIDGGRTDLDNLALVCVRHHVDITATSATGNGWEITMMAGVPWVRPPSWIAPRRPLLRNAVHHAPCERG